MADLIKKIKIKKQDGTFTDYIPIGAEAKNVNLPNEDSLLDFLTEKEEISITGNPIVISDIASTSFKDIKFFGNIIQESIPSPTSPSAINIVTGAQTINIKQGSETENKLINLGYNIFNPDDIISFLEGDFIGSSGHYRDGTSEDQTILLPCEPNTTYTITKPLAPRDSRFRVGFSSHLMTADEMFSIWGGGDTATKITLTSGNDSHYMYIFFAASLIDREKYLKTLQITKSDIEYPFSNYFQPIFLGKINNEKEYIYKQNGQWYKHALLAQIDISKIQESNWTYYNDCFTTTALDLAKIKTPLSNDNIVNGIISNCYATASAQALYTAVQDFGVAMATDRLVFKHNGISTVQEWVEYITTHKIELYLPLLIKEEQLITNNKVIEDLERVNNFRISNSNIQIECIGNIAASLNVIAYKNCWNKNTESLKQLQATKDYLGMIKVGEGLNIDAQGKLSVTRDVNSDVPDYFLSQLENKIPEINNNMRNVGRHGETFIFITDTHWENNAKHSPALLRYILNNTNIYEIIHGGDFLTSYDTKERAYNALVEARQAFSNFNNAKFITIVGNHDNNGVSSSTASHLNEDEIYNAMFKMQEKYITKWNDDEVDVSISTLMPFYFYSDNPSTKTRKIFLSACHEINTAQLNWLEQVLQASSDWNVLIFAHWLNYGDSAETYTNSAQALMTLCDTYKTIIKGIFTGHIHYDKIDHTTGGIPIIFTTEDGFISSPTFTSKDIFLGTVTEQAFDVITVDYDNNTIKCVRIGRGENRTVESNV